MYRNGCERSGLFCAALYMIEKLKLDQEVDVFHAVKHVRLSRTQNVQSLVSCNVIFHYLMSSNMA